MANEHIFNNNIVVTGSVSSSVGFFGDGSGLSNITSTSEWDGSRDGDSSITGSLVISGSGAAVNLLNAEAGVSGSFSGSFEGDGSKLTGLNLNSMQASGSILSGSFSGSYIGDGSGLTGLNNFPFNGDAVISGSLLVSGSFVNLVNATGVSGSFSGSFEGDGSGLTNLPSSEWDGSRNGDSSITGSFVVSGSGITVDLKGDVVIDENILISNRGDSNSIAIGVDSLPETTTSRCSIALGYRAAAMSLSGSCNVHIGYNAGSGSAQVVGDTGIGFQSLKNSIGIDTGDGSNNSCNTGVGFQTLCANTQGVKNTAAGANALHSNTTGACNVAVGHEAACNLTLGTSNTSIGEASGVCLIDGTNNTLVGHRSGHRIESSKNVSVGDDALRGNGDITGDCNTALGSCAGQCVTGASVGNVYIGPSAGPTTGTTESNQLYINNAGGTPLIKGDFSTCQVNFRGGVSGSFSGSFGGDGSGLNNITSTPNLQFRIFQTGSGTNSIVPVNGTNIATDTFSNVLGGNGNRSTGDYSAVVNGLYNTASANYSFVGGGTNNNISVSAISSSIVGGFNNVTEKTNSHIIGSNLTADKNNYSFMNNLDVEGIVSASTFTGIFDGAVSSSAQIAADISGSLGVNAALIRSLTSASISGSLSADAISALGAGILSGSTQLPEGVISASGQFTDITAPFTGSFTGSFTGDGSNLTSLAPGSNTEILFNNSGELGASSLFTFTNNDTLTIGDNSTGNADGQIHLKEEDNSTTAILINSGSDLALYRTNLTTALKHNGTQWSFEGTGSATSTSTGAVIIKGGLGVAGNLHIGGTLTSTEVVTNIVSQSISFASGSTIFGDSISDTHVFTGSLDVSGSISGVTTVTSDSGSFNGGLTSNGFVILPQVSASLNFADDTAAAAGGVPLGGLYRNGNVVAIRIT